MYTFLIVLILIASVLMVLAVLVQNPKSGMASNFGASNQVMGVRQTADFLEKFTWAMVAAIVFFSLLSVTAMPKEAEQVQVQNGVQQAINDNMAEATEVEGEELAVEASAEEAPAIEVAPVETTEVTEEL